MDRPPEHPTKIDGLAKFIQNIAMLEISDMRRKEKDNDISKEELGKLHARIGSLSWLPLNSSSDICATSEMQSEVTSATVETLIGCYDIFVETLIGCYDISVETLIGCYDTIY
eukprot:3577358-Heterocapsa_arctica.AAC.1